MLSLAFCSLLITQCFAHGIGRHGSYPRVKPGDTEDGVSSKAPNGFVENNNKDWSIPDVKFLYNYEQMRRGQPVEIDQREGTLGNYMYINPVTTTSTTTTTPTPLEIIDDFMNDKAPGIHGVFDTPIIVLESPHHRHHHHHHHHHANHPHHTVSPIPSFPEQHEVIPDIQSWDNWNEQFTFPAKMPPPPSLPKWKGYEVLEQYPYLQHLAHTSHPHTSHKLQQELTSSATQNKVELHRNRDNIKKHIHPVSTQSSRDDDITATTVKQVLSEIQPSPSLGHNTRNKTLHNHRGNHKFSWDHHVTQLPSSSTFSNIPLQKGNPPPPVPTLSPWYDGFGK